LLRDTDRLEWLERKATQSGFAIDRHAVRLQSKRIWRWSRGADSARHDGVDFEGLLTVVEPALFSGALLKGIGSAKAFGFGLLSIAPLRSS
jgi:CRISPR system Cascade subunit CasE